MFHHFSRLLIAILVLPAANAKIPDGIWVVDREPECGSVRCRVELAGGPEAFLATYSGLRKGTAKETPRGIVLEFPPGERGGPATTLVLKPDGDAFADQRGEKWIPRERFVKIDPAWTPVTVKVIDQDKKPLEHFQYAYSIESQNGRWSPHFVRPQDFDPDQGGIVVRAPAECVIHLSILHPDVIDGYNNRPEARRKNGAREVVAVVDIGKTVSGKVVDAGTGKPVAGARVSPLMFCPPAYLPNKEKSVVTGPDGSFSIHGVDFSYSVRHPDFVDQRIYLLDKSERARKIDGQVVRLDPGETFAGIVCDTEGKPLGGVEIQSPRGKSAVSANDGAFTLRGLDKRKEFRRLSFSKSGYADAALDIGKIGKRKRLAIMRKLPEFRGHVVLPDGSPARSCRILCGPGKAPASFQCSKATVVLQSAPPRGRSAWTGRPMGNPAP